MFLIILEMLVKNCFFYLVCTFSVVENPSVRRPSVRTFLQYIPSPEESSRWNRSYIIFAKESNRWMDSCWFLSYFIKLCPDLSLDQSNPCRATSVFAFIFVNTNRLTHQLCSGAASVCKGSLWLILSNAHKEKKHIFVKTLQLLLLCSEIFTICLMWWTVWFVKAWSFFLNKCGKNSTSFFILCIKIHCIAYF